jgi:nucleoside-diphosphate-sugar epimerase
MRILVLGSSGVVGSALVNHLKKKKYDVVEFDLMKGDDLRIRGSIDSILDTGIDFVYFLAFDVGGSKYPMNSTTYISNNMKLLQYTFESLEKYKIPFIHTTSQMSNMDHNPYGPLKKIAEFYTTLLGGVNVKLWNVYGPEEIGLKSHVITDFIHQAITHGCIKMLTDGSEKRQFLHADDFADSLERIRNSYPSGSTIDVSSGKWVTIREIADMICDTVIPGTEVSTFQTKTNEPSSEFIATQDIPLEIGIQRMKFKAMNSL